MAARRKRGFSWIPRKYTTRYSVSIGGVDITIGADLVSASFTKSLLPETGKFSLRLDNNDGDFTDVYSGGEEVEFKYDFTSGTANTRRFLGVIDELRPSYGQKGAVIDVIGSHVTGELTNKLVNATYSGVLGDMVVKDLMSQFAPSNWTTNNVKTTSVSVTLTFNAVPLLQALFEVAEFCGFEIYGDDSRDLHFSKQGINNNDQDAVVFNDTHVSLKRLGKGELDVRTKVQVYSELDGLPIIATASTDDTPVKELAVKDIGMLSVDEAEFVASQELDLRKDAKDIGGGRSLLLASLNPGDMLYITIPPQRILDRFRIVKFTHHIPIQMTDYEVGEFVSVNEIFRDRIRKTFDTTAIVNIHNLDFSYNFSFDDDSLTDSVATNSNVVEIDSQLILDSGSTGTWVSLSKNVDKDITQVQVQALGEALQDATFFVQVEGSNFQQIVLDKLEAIVNSGKLLRLKIVFSTNNTRINSVAILFS